MDNEERFILAAYRVERAKEELDSAQLLFDNRKFRDANGKSYYSIFHSIKAVLAIEGRDFKRHKDAIAYFNKAYVKTEVFPKELGRLIHISSDIREDNDYEDFYIASKEDAEKQIDTAKMITELVEKYVEENKLK